MTRLSADPLNFDAYEAILVDMDGVLIFGTNPAPGAIDFVKKAGRQLMVVTNESRYGDDRVARFLQSLGFDINKNQVITACEKTIEILSDTRRAKNFLIKGAPGLHQLASEAGLQSCSLEDGIDIVLLGRDPDFSVETLQEMTSAIEDGAELWVTNDDQRHPIEDGRFTYQTGALLAALLACVGEVPVEVVGKPSSWLFEEALRRLSATPKNSVMIGDNKLTDGAGSVALGMPFIHLSSSGAADARFLSDLAPK